MTPDPSTPQSAESQQSEGQHPGAQPPEVQLPASDGSSDPHLWLEDVTGEDALAWVRERNGRAESELDRVADPRSSNGDALTETLYREIRAILDASDRIPGVTARGDYLYNFWTDSEHERGLWRRTTWESYRTDDPQWDVLLDIDALNAAEGENWVWHGAQLLRPAEGEPYRLALVSLSRGGSDADVTREFDLETRQFVPGPDEGGTGFVRPEAKGGVSWIDADTLWVSTDFGEDSLTASGYPRQARIWRRGQQLEDAELVFNAEHEDMLVSASHDSTPDWEQDWIVRMRNFYETEYFTVDHSAAAGDSSEAESAAHGKTIDGNTPAESSGHASQLIQVDVPAHMQMFAHRDLLVFLPRQDWTVADRTYPAGSLLVANAEQFLAGSYGTLEALFEPTDSASLEDVTCTVNTIVLTVLDDVVHRLEVHTRNGEGTWARQDLYPELVGALAVGAVDPTRNDELWITVSSFIEPTQLLLGDLAAVSDGGEAAPPELIKSAPERFDASGAEVSQHFATSEDGTRIPYFVIGDPERERTGPGPTLLYGYGGFEISLTPSYLGAIGKAWVERGGTYVVANIRGGGEYGPAWHQAALKEHRHRAYEDFASVAKDVIDRGITTAKQLAVRGGSNGGLLTGNMLTQYPELFGAVIIQVPLLDMKRFSHLLAGNSWMAEYGDPDTADWDFIRTFSPYHLLRTGVEYPPAFVLTSTRDDRVHPGHARKFTAALESLGADVRSWENIEGGHGGAATNDQAARMSALMYAFAWKHVGAE